jgi:hypothetical protein
LSETETANPWVTIDTCTSNGDVGCCQQVADGNAGTHCYFILGAGTTTATIKDASGSAVARSAFSSCGTSYEFRVTVGTTYGYGPATQPVFTPLCKGGASLEQCGVRYDGTYKCKPADKTNYVESNEIIATSDIERIQGIFTRKSWRSHQVKAWINIAVTSGTALTLDMFKELGNANAFTTAVGEILEIQTGISWLNASSNLGDMTDCSTVTPASDPGCVGLGITSALALQVTVDCGMDETLATNIYSQITTWSSATDSTTGRTYLEQFTYLLLYYMQMDTYTFVNMVDYDPTMKTDYKAYESLAYSSFSCAGPGTTSPTPTATYNGPDNYVGPLSSDWMPTTSEGWSQFEFSLRDHSQGTTRVLWILRRHRRDINQYAAILKLQEDPSGGASLPPAPVQARLIGRHADLWHCIQ